MGRCVLRVTLHGSPRDSIFLRIQSESGQKDPNRFFKTVLPFNEAQKSRQSRGPPPSVSLQANKGTIHRGESFALSWETHNAQSVKFTSGELGTVGSSGSALDWPEEDTLYQLKAKRGQASAGVEVIVKVAGSIPELELEIEPKTVYKGQEATLTCKTKNAKLVRVDG
jgi:hypothetical protein